MAVTRDQVAKLYVANFNRAPDAAGLDYWISDGTSATTTLTDLNAIAASMQAGAEASTGVASMTNSEYVISLYSSMFGRTVAADSADVAYWTNDITLGNVTRANMIQTLILGAEASTGSATDAAVLANKTTVGLAYADAGLNGTYSLTSVTADAATVTAAQADIDDLANPGQAFSLTNSATADTIIGTAGNDTITGASGTVANADLIIDQSTTDNDTANLVITAAYTPTNISKIENVNIDWNAFGTATVNTTGVTGADAITLTTSKVGFLGNSAVTAGASQHIIAGSGMVGTMTITGATTAITVDATNSAAVSVTGTGTATVNAGVSTTSVTTSGFATATIDAGTATAISVTDAAATTNATTVTVGATATLTNVATGAVTLDVADGKNVTVSAIGASLNVVGDGDVTITSGALTTETLTNNKTSGTLTVVNTAAAAALNVLNVAADTINLSVATNNTVTAANGANFTTAVNQTSAVFTDGATTPVATNAVTLTNTAATQTSVTSTNFSTLNVVSNATAVTGTDATYATLGNGTRTINLSGTNDVVVTNGTAGTFNAAGLTGNLTYTQQTDVATIISGATATNTIVFAGTTVDSSYTGQNGNDTVTFVNTTGNATAILGDGANSVTATASTTGSVVVIGGAGIDTISVTTAGNGTGEINFNLAAGNDVMTVNGTGDDVVTIDSGAGDDSLTLSAASTANDVMTLAFGDGTDTLNVSTDLTAGTWAVTGLETIAMGSNDGAAKVGATMLSGKSYTVTGDGTATDALIVEIDATGSFDFSGIVVNQTITLGSAGLEITDIAGVNTTIVGSAYADTITAAAGTNTITGGAGLDVLVGGAGTDTYVFVSGHSGLTTATVDTITTAFTSGTDKINLGLAGTVTNYAEAVSTYDNVTTRSTVEQNLTQANTLLDGTVRIAVIDNATTDAGNAGAGALTGNASFVYFDLDGNGSADYAVQVVGSLTTAYTDFIA